LCYYIVLFLIRNVVRRSLVPATDPASFHAVLPVGGTEVSTGGHKGSGLAMVVEGLTAVLSGAWKLHQVGELAKNDPEWGEADETEWEKRSGSVLLAQNSIAHFRSGQTNFKPLRVCTLHDLQQMLTRVLCCAVLCCAVLCCAVLCCAV
jgi:hypothetical protein